MSIFGLWQWPDKDCAGALNLAGVSVIGQLVKEHDSQCAPDWGFGNFVVCNSTVVANHQVFSLLILSRFVIRLSPIHIELVAGMFFVQDGPMATARRAALGSESGPPGRARTVNGPATAPT
jgi:hypothetical protein